MIYFLAFGNRPFALVACKIHFAPEPRLPHDWFTRQDLGKVPKNGFSLRLFGVPVTFVNSKGKSTLGPGAVKPSAFERILDGRYYESKGRTLTPDASEALRE